MQHNKRGKSGGKHGRLDKAPKQSRRRSFVVCAQLRHGLYKVFLIEMGVFYMGTFFFGIGKHDVSCKGCFWNLYFLFTGVYLR